MGYDKLLSVLKHLPGGHDQHSHAGVWKARGVPKEFCWKSANMVAEHIASVVNDPDVLAARVRKTGKFIMTAKIYHPTYATKVGDWLRDNMAKYGYKKADMKALGAQRNRFEITLDFGSIDEGLRD